MNSACDLDLLISNSLGADTFNGRTPLAHKLLYEGRGTQVLRDDRFVRRVRKSRREPRQITVYKLDGSFYFILMYPYEDRH